MHIIVVAISIALNGRDRRAMFHAMTRVVTRHRPLSSAGRVVIQSAVASSAWVFPALFSGGGRGVPFSGAG